MIFQTASHEVVHEIVWRLVLSRLWQGVLVLLAVTFLTFWLLASAGGDALAAAGHDAAISPAAATALRRVYGLDRPLLARYADWLAGIIRGDLGVSLYFHAPVASVLPARLLRTLLLGTMALLIAWAIGFGCGVLAASGTVRSRRFARFCRAATTLAFATPRLVLALCALALLASFDRTGAFPTAGQTTSDAAATLGRLLVAAVVLAVPLAAVFLTHTQTSFAAALSEDFVIVARAKGLPERLVLLRHAARAALNPLITIFGLSLGNLLSGSVVVESVLGWSGVGQLCVLAVRSRDVPLLLSIVLVTSFAVLLGNLACDILLRVNDPRLATGARRNAVG